jgi:Mitochondrial inner membrane protein
MSEFTSQPPEPEADPPVPPTVAPARRHLLFPALTAAGFLILAAAVVWVWRHPAVPPTASQQTEALAHQLSELEALMARLEQRPPPQIPDLGPLGARVTALEQRPPPQGGTAPAPDLAPIERRLTAQEQRQPPNLAPLDARLAAIEAASRSAQADLGRRVDTVEGRLAASEKANRRIPVVLAAAMALAAGQRLGDLPGAPSALARFADAAPPTEAALRLAFPQAAREALAVSHPAAAEGQPLLMRLWVQAQGLVTVRQGDRVLIGDPAAGVLAHARADLEAGDLAAAVADVAKLEGAAAQAMSAWLEQARSLLQARAALAAWAASG